MRPFSGRAETETGSAGFLLPKSSGDPRARTPSTSRFEPLGEKHMHRHDPSRSLPYRTRRAARAGQSFAGGSGVLAAVLVVAVLHHEPALAEEPWFVRGDATSDGVLDISDPTVTLRHLFLEGAEPACLDALDADDTGSVNISDAISILGFLFHGGSPPPAPYPAAGADPTEDGLACGASKGGIVLAVQRAPSARWA